MGISTEKGKHIKKQENAQNVKSQIIECIDQEVDRMRTSRSVRRDWGFN